MCGGVDRATWSADMRFSRSAAMATRTRPAVGTDAAHRTESLSVGETSGIVAHSVPQCELVPHKQNVASHCRNSEGLRKAKSPLRATSHSAAPLFVSPGHEASR